MNRQKNIVLRVLENGHFNMKVQLAENINKTRKITFQNDFPETTSCCRCGAESRMGFVAHEFDEPISQEGGKFLCDLYENPSNEGYWLHDACAVAVYFCTKCLEPTSLYNQA